MIEVDILFYNSVHKTLCGKDEEILKSDMSSAFVFISARMACFFIGHSYKSIQCAVQGAITVGGYEDSVIAPIEAG